MSDAINPDHYKRLPAEAIEIIESAIDNAPSNQDAYLHGQVLKYILRCWNKNGIEDLKKAKWYLDRLVDSLDEYEQQKSSDLQSLKDHPFGKLRQQEWTPKIGDWVRIKKPAETRSDAVVWFEMMDEHDGKILQVEKIEYGAIVHDNLGFLFDWLEPAEPPKPTVEVAVEVTGEVKNPLGCPYGWRFLEVGEVIRKGDQGFENGLFHAIDSLIGMELQAHWRPTIRRNRFEVGEKVVRVLNGAVYKVIAKRPDETYELKTRKGLLNCLFAIDLAPYIEETK